MNGADTEAAGSSWSTASFGLPADTSPMELTALGEHLSLCRTDHRLSTLHCALQALRSFVAAHLATSVTVLAVAAFATWLFV